MWRVLAGSLVVGCSFNPSAGPSDARGDGGSDTAPVDGDAPSDTPPPDTTACFGENRFTICVHELTVAPTVDLPAMIDTVDSTLCASSIPPSVWPNATQPDVCLIVGQTVTAAGAVRATGVRPLVIVATGVLTITAGLDAASHPGAPGAGANATDCPTAGTPGSNSAGGGGGPGGSFMTTGGDGGASPVAAGGNAGPAFTAPPTVLRGGCRGKTGGEGGGNGSAGDPGAGGSGGGAVYLVGGTSMSLAGAINVSGSGGRDGNSGANGGGGGGGGGAGSGGMLVLWSPSFTTGGVNLLANGGGGAAGADDDSDGEAGQDPDPNNVTASAQGGSTAQRGGAGGRGFAGVTPAGSGGTGNNSNEAGGGGGGGGGFIATSSTITPANISPEPGTIP